MSFLQSVLVVDADSASRELISFGFERIGCAIQATASATDAIELAEGQRPSVLVLSTHCEGMKAVDFIRALRAGEAARDLPVLVVGEESQREALRAAGADQLLGRPASLMDLVALAKLEAARCTQGGGEARGQIAEYGIYFVTRALIRARSSGVLRLDRSGRQGELCFFAGELARARVGQQQGANAFHQLLLWDRGALSLRFEVPDGGRKIRKPVDRLLEDGARFVTEFEAIADKVGGTKVVYEVNAAELEQVRRRVPHEVMALVSAYDGRRTLIDVVEDSPFKPFDTIMITHRLSELGAIRRCEVGPPMMLAALLREKDWLVGVGDPSEPKGPTGRVRKARLARSRPEAGAETMDRTDRTDVVPPAGGTTVEATDRQPRTDFSAAKDETTERTTRVEKVALTVTAASGDPAPPAKMPSAPKKSMAPATLQLSWGASREPRTPRPPQSEAQLRRFAKIDPAALFDAKPRGKEFDPVEEDFFAREKEIHQVDPVDNFDDLSEPRPKR